MQTKLVFKSSTFLVCCLASASIGHASLAFNVNTDTSALIGNPSGPFSLDFQLIDGSGAGDANNTVTINNFNFGGGGWVGLDPAPISLTDTAFFSDFFDEFTPGTFLSFDVSLTTNVDAGGTPDAFSFAILDNGLTEIPTHGLGDALLAVDLDSSSARVRTFSSDLSRTAINIPAPVAHSVPDAMPTGFWLASVMGVLIFCQGLLPVRACWG